MNNRGGLALLAAYAHAAHSPGMLSGPFPAQAWHADRNAQTQASLKRRTANVGERA
jgi:hypothetical protein